MSHPYDSYQLTCSWKVKLEKSLIWKVFCWGVFSWKDQLSVGKNHLKFEKPKSVGKISLKLESPFAVGKILLYLERPIAVGKIPTSNGSFQLRIDLSN